MRAGNWHLVGLIAILWLANSDFIDRLLPVPMPPLTVARLRDQVPDLVEHGGIPDLAATTQARRGLVPDPAHPLAELRLRCLAELLSSLAALRVGTGLSADMAWVMRERPPDSDAAVAMLGEWFDAGETAVLSKQPIPPARMGEDALAAVDRRPLAAAVLTSLPVEVRRRLTSALIVERLIRNHPIPPDLPR